MRCERGGEGLLALHNNTGASETAEGRENAAEGRSRTSVADSGREGQRRILTPFLLALRFSSALRLFCCHCFPLSRSLYSSVSHPDSQLSLSVLFSLTYGYLTVGFSFRRVSSSSPTPLCLSSSHLYLYLPCTIRSPSVVLWCEDASVGRSLGPRSEDAGLWPWGGSWGLSG